MLRILQNQDLEFPYHIVHCVQRKVMRVITNKQNLSNGEFGEMKWLDLQVRGIRANISNVYEMETTI